MTGRHAADKSARKRSARVTETSEFMAFAQRIAISVGDRLGNDPAGLVQARELVTMLQDHLDRGVFLANRQGRYSQNELAAMAGISRQAIAKRVRRGELVHAELQRRRGAGALIRLVDLRARRAELLEAAGVEDRTGSDRERGLRAVGQ